jgi:type II secretory pathway pseudopilin PulG
MKKKSAFTLVEVLIAILISGFVISALLQIMSQTYKFVEQGERLMTVDREVTILFNQMEKDFSSAFIPTLKKEIKIAKKPKQDPAKQGANKKQQPQVDEEVEDTKETPTDFFVASSKDEEFTGFRVGFKKGQKLLDKVSFICTNPLRVFGQDKMRLVRVGYQLVLNKENSEEEKPSYDLWRLECGNLENKNLKPDESLLKKDSKNVVYNYLVVKNIKGIYLEYVKILSVEKKDGQTSEDVQIDRFEWGDDDKTKDILPTMVRINLVIWNKKKTREYVFENLIPVFSCQDSLEEKTQKSTVDDDKKKQGDDKNKKKPSPKTPSKQASKKTNLSSKNEEIDKNLKELLGKGVDDKKLLVAKKLLKIEKHKI